MGAHDRNVKSLRRRGPGRDRYDRVLIVCEGSKSEPDYFRALAQDLKLGSAQVVVTGDSDSAPIKVVEKAIKLFQQDRDFDQVYCVFDRDQHDTYRVALERVASETLTIRRNGRALGVARFEAIPSVPCFEYWLLLHFRYTVAPFARGTEVVTALKVYPGFERYEKGKTDAYAATCKHLENALRHAERANAATAEAGTDNPSTRIPDLVQALQRIAGGHSR